MKPLRLSDLVSGLIAKSIRIRIWLSMLLCVVAIGVVAFSNFSIMQNATALPAQLYNQPYQVGLAVRDLRADVIVMHGELTDLARSPSRLALRRFERRMQEIDTRAQELRQTISERFPGDPAIVRDAFASHSEWNVVRRQVAQAIRDGDQVKAYTLAKTEGYNQVKYLDEGLHRLITVANQHSRSLYEKADSYLDIARFQGAGAVLLALLFLGTAATMVNRMIVRPVREIGDAMSNIANGNLSTVIPHDARTDEIGQIARSSRVFLNHAIAIQESSIDLLTSLPKRKQILNHIARCRMDAERREWAGFLLHIDLDGFVEVNDALGRDIGDQLLVQVSNRLRAALGKDDFLAREGADSFVWFRSVGEIGDAPMELAEQIQVLVERPIPLEEQEIALECSIGIVVADDKLSPDALLVRAENAFIDTKRSSERSISVYTDEMNARLLRRRKTLRGLRSALRHDEITPYYQPQVEARSGELHGFESLVRWNHPEYGILAPLQFLPIAQSAGLMGAITETMISKSLAQLAEWRDQGLVVPRISLNLDGRDLGREGFADRLMLELDRHGLNPTDVCLELLESAMIEDGENPVSRTLNRLGQLGFPIELDDFGTGHAAIASLRLIALNGIKIDRSFVTKLHERPGQIKLTRAMLRLAHALQIKTVAEGVESIHERRVLVELGCDTLQGFGIGKPMSAEAATRWLEAFTPAVGQMLDVRKSA